MVAGEPGQGHRQLPGPHRLDDEAVRAKELAVALPRLARQHDVRLQEVRALDDSLESLFRELVR